MKDLKTLHREISEVISQLDFSRIWPGFAPLRFAIYNGETCCFDGEYVEKTADFCANTSIVYRGEQIAIWQVDEALALPVFASKLVHEMFHGFQTQQGWSCWPDELEALFRYEYEAENLACKLRENELLLTQLDRFDAEALAELLALRKYRSTRFPYQFDYELRTEEIEGTANFVEWQVLRQLDPARAAALTERMRAALTKPERLFPIRISGYFTGALMIHALLAAGRYDFAPAARPALCGILETVPAGSGAFPGKAERVREAAAAVEAFHAETEAMIRSALERNELVLRGPAELGFVNIYDARCRSGFLTSNYFLLLRDAAGERTLNGNFVIQMRDEKTIEAVYRLA